VRDISLICFGKKIPMNFSQQPQLKCSESRNFLLSKIFLLSLEKVDLIENSDVAVFY
jgi:hypothetical protein